MTRKPDDALAELEARKVGSEALGALLGITGRRVRELAAAGRIPREPDGRYRVAPAVRAYCAEMRPAVGGGAIGGSAAAETLDQARTRVAMADAELKQIEIDKRRGDLIPAADLEIALAVAINDCRTRLLALPKALAPALAAMRTEREVRDRLAAEIHASLESLAATSVAVAARDGGDEAESVG